MTAPPVPLIASASVQMVMIICIPPSWVSVRTITPSSSTYSELLMPGAVLTVLVHLVTDISRPSALIVVFSPTMRVVVAGARPELASTVRTVISLAPLLKRCTM